MCAVSVRIVVCYIQAFPAPPPPSAFVCAVSVRVVVCYLRDGHPYPSSLRVYFLRYAVFDAGVVGVIGGRARDFNVPHWQWIPRVLCVIYVLSLSTAPSSPICSCSCSPPPRNQSQSNVNVQRPLVLIKLLLLRLLIQTRVRVTTTTKLFLRFFWHTVCSC